MPDSTLLPGRSDSDCSTRVASLQRNVTTHWTCYGTVSCYESAVLNTSPQELSLSMLLAFPAMDNRSVSELHWVDSRRAFDPSALGQRK